MRTLAKAGLLSRACPHHPLIVGRVGGQPHPCRLRAFVREAAHVGARITKGNTAKSNTTSAQSERNNSNRRRLRCELPFIRFYFETRKRYYAELVGEVSVDVYDDFHLVLEKIAQTRRMILTESLIETEEEEAL